MRKISLTVNGSPRQAEVAPRTQLAVLLRDGLHLTGTHLGCEQGVCGACTVLIDGKPVRSCLTYAVANDGAEIETIEGFRSDPTMAALRRAFSEHHALQCGFCTPGMLITARDIVLRLGDPDEKLIRQELSGNICRCTGYVGIVRAIAAVISERGVAPPARSPAPPATPPLQPFTLSEESLNLASAIATAALTTAEAKGGWTSVEERMILAHSPKKVWALFSDTERVAACIPGATISAVSQDAFQGALTITFGPIKASFGGEGERSLNELDRSGVIRAQGKDASGQSNARGELIYRLRPALDGEQTTADLSLRFQISGILAQFNRPDLVEGFVSLLLSQFAANCDATLAGKAPAAPALSGFGLLIALVKQRLRKKPFPSRPT